MAERKLLSTFTHPLEAEIVRGRLESEGIHAELFDNNTISMNWLYSNAIGGVKLFVPSADFERAKEVLQIDENTFEDSGWGACPHCSSRKIELQLDRRASYLTWILLGVPLLFPKKSFLCNSCGGVSTKLKQ